MKDMLSFLIARDAMHQQQWLAVIEDRAAPRRICPSPTLSPHHEEKQEFSYAFLAPVTEDGPVPAEAAAVLAPTSPGWRARGRLAPQPRGGLPAAVPPREAEEDAMAIRVLPTRTHGIIDHVTGSTLVWGPTLLGMDNDSVSTRASRLAGGGATAYSLVTD